MPTKVYDGITGKEISFVMDGNTVILPDAKFEKHETRIFALPRPVSLADALRVWWGEKEKYWRQGGKIQEADVIPAPAVTLPIDSWKFSAAPEDINQDASLWSAKSYSCDSWKDMPCGSWKIMSPDLKNHRGAAIYRKEFVLPAEWTGHKIIFNFQTRSAIRDKAEFHLNGTLFSTFDSKLQHPEFHGTYSKDVTSLLSLTGVNVLAVKVYGGEASSISGICDTLWFSRERNLSPQISLDGDWECVKEDLQTFTLKTIPGAFGGRYIRRRFTVPEEWRGKRVFLRLETPVINIGSVMINEQAKGLNGAFPPFGHRTEINISELIRPGRENTVELWHRHTIPTNYIGVQWKWPKESKISIDHVVIGIEDEN
ncbi:MAG: hypothetical protein WC637_03795 [Victivallales bacterium]